jgi:hypothetical protein
MRVLVESTGEVELREHIVAAVIYS